MTLFLKITINLVRFLGVKSHRSINLIRFGTSSWKNLSIYLEIYVQLGQIYLLLTSSFFRKLFRSQLLEDFYSFFKLNTFFNFTRFLCWILLIRHLFWAAENWLYIYPLYSQITQLLLTAYVCSRLFLPALTFRNTRRDFFFTFYFIYLALFIWFSSKLGYFLDLFFGTFFLDYPELYFLAWYLSLFFEPF